MNGAVSLSTLPTLLEAPSRVSEGSFGGYLHTVTFSCPEADPFSETAHEELYTSAGSTPILLAGRSHLLLFLM